LLSLANRPPGAYDRSGSQRTWLGALAQGVCVLLVRVGGRFWSDSGFPDVTASSRYADLRAKPTPDPPVTRVTDETLVVRLAIPIGTAREQ
jgi:hypothetical protein